MREEKGKTQSEIREKEIKTTTKKCIIKIEKRNKEKQGHRMR